MTEIDANQIMLEALMSRNMVKPISVSKSDVSSRFSSDKKVIKQNRLGFGVKEHPGRIGPNVSAPKIIFTGHSGELPPTSREWTIVTSAKGNTLGVPVVLYTLDEYVTDPSAKAVVDEANHKVLESLNISKSLYQYFDEELSVHDVSDTQVLSTLRFVKRQDAFFKRHPMLPPKEALTLLNINDSNTGRAIGKLVERHQLISVSYHDKRLIPAFQFNDKRKVYPALLSILPEIVKHEINTLDLCFWLTDYQSVVFGAPANEFDPRADSFEAMMQNATANAATANMYEGTPLEALVRGEESTFLKLFSLWLSPEDYDLTSTSSIDA